MGIVLLMRLVNVSRNCWWEFNDSSLSIYHLYFWVHSYVISPLWFKVRIKNKASPSS